MGVQREKRPQSAPGFGTSKVLTSTAASTAISVDSGLVAMRSSSTGGPVVYDLAGLPKARS